MNNSACIWHMINNKYQLFIITINFTITVFPLFPTREEKADKIADEIKIKFLTKTKSAT